MALERGYESHWFHLGIFGAETWGGWFWKGLAAWLGGWYRISMEYPWNILCRLNLLLAFYHSKSGVCMSWVDTFERVPSWRVWWNMSPTSQSIATEIFIMNNSFGLRKRRHSWFFEKKLQGILETGQFESWIMLNQWHVDVHLQESNRQELSTDIVLPHCREDLNLGVFFKQTWWGGWGRTPLGVFECFWWFKGTAELV